jgi:hypothetical protein
LVDRVAVTTEPKARTAELPRPNGLADHWVAYDTTQGWGAGQQTGSNPHM